MFRVDGSLEEFETYEEAETELLEIMDDWEILEFIDCSCADILHQFLRRQNITDFEVWFSEKINEAIERLKNNSITEYEDEEDE